MINLLEETLQTLESHGKTESDVRWVGCSTHKVSWEDFKRVANVKYDCGYGGQEVAADLIIVGDNWHLERRQYDGSEWWEFKRTPVEPPLMLELKALIRSQVQSDDWVCGGGSLIEYNTNQE
jgi:hypothetical protein